MNTETKNKLKDVAADAAEDAAEWLKQEAKASTGVMRWIWGILALLAMGVVTWLSTGCEAVTPGQIYAAHDLYHKLSDEHCIFVVEDKSK
jgi:drug/metabolite transporter superfamily protein YnfA